MPGRLLIFGTEHEPHFLAALLHPDRSGDDRRFLTLVPFHCRRSQDPGCERIRMHCDRDTIIEYRDARHEAVQCKTKIGCRERRNCCGGKIIICASGAAAEQEVCGVSREAEGDDEQIAWLLGFLPERSRREDRFRRFAGQLLRRHKRVIMRVAADLAIARQLRGSHIDFVVREETLGASTSVLASQPANVAEFHLQRT